MEETKAEHYHLYTRPRHNKFVYLVDDEFEYDDLVALMRENLRYWGGRYNAIIPVRGGKIPEEYFEFAGLLDPDIVWYTKRVDIQEIKALQVFHPESYEPLEVDRIEGVNAYYLVSLSGRRGPVLLSGNLYNSQIALLDFYRLNFGLGENAIVSDYAIVRDLPQTIIDSDNFQSINRILHKEKPLHPAELARLNVEFSVFRSQESSATTCELVIAKDKTSREDLLYFWNRQLYENGNIIYVTLPELLILSKDSNWGGLLFDLSLEVRIEVVSRSLSISQITELIQKHLTPIAFKRLFFVKELSSFPFAILSNDGYVGSFQEQIQVQALQGDSGILNLPSLSFAKKLEHEVQSWVIVLQIKLAHTLRNVWLYFPATTDIRSFIESSGRINKYRQLCLFVRNRYQYNGVADFSIPSFHFLLHQVLTRPIIDSERRFTRYHRIDLHDSSRRLMGFLQTFKYDFDTINDFFIDKFWVDVFETLCTSDKAAGDSITFEELSASFKGVLEKLGKPPLKREVSLHNWGNLSKGLLHHFQRLCDMGVFLPGFRLKCSACSSIHWYSLSSVNTKVQCVGCSQSFLFLAETPFAYKLNDLIGKNIYQTKTQRDGNLTVIRTLAYLARNRGYLSFDYRPQINLFDSFFENRPVNEIDFACLGDGKLIIGEAKHNSMEFMENKQHSLLALLEVASYIEPDILVLSCYIDTNNKLKNAGDFLRTKISKWVKQPEIVTHLLAVPDYRAFDSNRYYFYGKDVSPKGEHPKVSDYADA